MPKKGKVEYKESFEVFAKGEAFYTSGKIQFSNNGEFILSICEGQVKQFHFADGKTRDAVETFEGEEIVSFILAEDDDTLITAAKNGIMRHWQLSIRFLVKTWKSVHTGIVSCLAFDASSTLVATGGSDSTIKVWDIVQKYYTHNLKGGKGVYSKICFNKIGSELHVVGAADDYDIHVWNLHTSQHIAALSGHYSTVTDFIILADGSQMLSSSRDKTVLMWDVINFKLLKTIPVYDTVESCFLVPENLVITDIKFDKRDIYFITAGGKGTLKMWSAQTGRCMYEQTESLIANLEDGDSTNTLIMQATYVPALTSIAVVSFEHNILLYGMDNLVLNTQFVGYNDDILSIKFAGDAENKIVVATNSSQIKVFEVPSFSCQLLKGHNDIVLSVDVFPCNKQMLVSGSKDNNVKVWDLNSESSHLSCTYTGFGHTGSVTAICCCRGKSRFFVSASEDTTLKLWEIPENIPLVALKLLLSPYCTVKAHDKLINSVDISRNDKLVATGSQDHTIKLWDTAELSHLGTFRGHKKGVWCVKFSPVDLVIASSSSDETVRIWSLTDFSCLKVFQGHESSVLQVLFLSQGTQLISSAADGNINLWDVKNTVCVKTLAQHTLKVWTLAASSNEEFVVSGSADSTIIVWKDTTQLEKQVKTAASDEYLLQEQELSNLVHNEKWIKALGLAITLDKPFQAYNIMEEILHKQNEKTVESVLNAMREDQRQTLLKFSLEWVTNSRTYFIATLVIRFFYMNYDSEELLKIPNMCTYIQEALPYLDRHFKRIQRRCQEMQLLNFLTFQMSTK